MIVDLLRTSGKYDQRMMPALPALKDKELAVGRGAPIPPTVRQPDDFIIAGFSTCGKPNPPIAGE
jgi:hypothetical protein